MLVRILPFFLIFTFSLCCRRKDQCLSEIIKSIDVIKRQKDFCRIFVPNIPMNDRDDLVFCEASKILLNVNVCSDETGSIRKIQINARGLGTTNCEIENGHSEVDLITFLMSLQSYAKKLLP